jgi:NAD(P)-dependent dehydrogenase (short-subunit alcohol dehydrogenase family)
MPSLAAIRADNAALSPSYLPVALFVGGTSGIGQATAQAFAHHTKGEAHVIICGRNRAAADSIIASFPKSPKSRYEFVQCDATLLKNVGSMTTKLLLTLPKLNFLVLSAGFLNFRGRDETSEGRARKLVIDYYSRWKFINDLMPLLRKAKDAGEDAKVLSVLAAAKGKPVNFGDLDVKDYSFSNEIAAAATYNDIMIEASFIPSVCGRRND